MWTEAHLAQLMRIPTSMDSNSDEHQADDETGDEVDRVVLIKETSDHSNEETDSVRITKPGTQNIVFTHYATPDKVDVPPTDESLVPLPDAHLPSIIGAGIEVVAESDVELSASEPEIGSDSVSEYADSSTGSFQLITHLKDSNPEVEQEPANTETVVCGSLDSNQLTYSADDPISLSSPPSPIYTEVQASSCC